MSWKSNRKRKTKKSGMNTKVDKEQEKESNEEGESIRRGRRIKET